MHSLLDPQPAMPEPAVLRYYVVDELVAEFNRVKDAKVESGRRFDAVNTKEAHWAPDYGEPHTELQLATRANDAAEMALREAHDRLVVTCAYLCVTDERLHGLLRQRLDVAKAQRPWFDTLFREIAEELAADGCAENDKRRRG